MELEDTEDMDHERRIEHLREQLVSAAELLVSPPVVMRPEGTVTSMDLEGDDMEVPLLEVGTYRVYGVVLDSGDLGWHVDMRFRDSYAFAGYYKDEEIAEELLGMVLGDRIAQRLEAEGLS
jgi:hypothetical protein